MLGVVAFGQGIHEEMVPIARKGGKDRCRSREFQVTIDRSQEVPDKSLPGFFQVGDSGVGASSLVGRILLQLVGTIRGRLKGGYLGPTLPADVE